MKTKQEILDKHLENKLCDRKKDYIDDSSVYDCIEAAMDEYALQFMNIKECSECKGVIGNNYCSWCKGAGKYILLPTITTTGT